MPSHLGVDGHLPDVDRGIGGIDVHRPVGIDERILQVASLVKHPGHLEEDVLVVGIASKGFHEHTHRGFVILRHLRLLQREVGVLRTLEVQLVVECLGGIDHSSLDVRIGKSGLGRPVIGSEREDGLACGYLLMGLALGVVDLPQQIVYLVILIGETVLIDVQSDQDVTCLVQLRGLEICLCKDYRSALVEGLDLLDVPANRYCGLGIALLAVDVAPCDHDVRIHRLDLGGQLYERPRLVYSAQADQHDRLVHE